MPAPSQRVELIRRSLAVVAEHDIDDYLDQDIAVEAVAAATVVASQLPGGPPFDSADAPAVLHGLGIALPNDLPQLALQALDRVDGDNSELAQLWEDGYTQVLEDRRPIRAALEVAATRGDTGDLLGQPPGSMRPITRKKAQVVVKFPPGTVIKVPAGADDFAYGVILPDSPI